MNKRICVLEDTEEILDVVTLVLEDEQYEVFGFSTVAEFMANVDRISPDLYLLDVMLPDGNGLDVCNDLKLSAHSKHVPVVIMTANMQVASMHEKCAAEEFIAKPFDIFHLVSTINRLMNNNL